jgi:hypothetical protein
MGNTTNCATRCADCHISAPPLFEDILPLESEISFSQPSQSASQKRVPFHVHFEHALMGLHWNNIGVVFSLEDSPTAITIDEISQFGLLPEWNDMQIGGFTKVQVGDMITAVNGVFGSNQQLFEKLQKLCETNESINLLIDPAPESFGKSRGKGPSYVSYASDSGPSTVKSRTLGFPELRPHFATLDISEASSDEAIRRQYRRLARIWHPDKNADNIEKAHVKFQAINHAFSMIREKLDL